MTYAQERAALLERREPFGPGRRAALSGAADRWLAELLTAATGGNDAGVALVAVGGYGRGELVAGSDLDVVLLHGKRRGIAAIADGVWYPVWDAGVKLDHSVRTPAEARDVAAQDLRALLGLLDLRHVAGDAGLTEQLRTSVLADWRSAAHHRLPELQESAAERDRSNGELAFLLEPDLKESRGGLRDLVTLRAVAASWVADVPHARIAGAHEKLLDVRDALHTVTGRGTDRLVLQEQDNVATELGLLDATALMRSLAEVGRTIAYASDVTWRRVDQVLAARSGRFRLRGGKPAPRTPLADGVVQADGEAVLARDADPARDPVLVLRAAAAAAQAGIPLSPGTVDRFAATAVRLPEPWPDAAREELVRLLGAGRPAVAVWESLDLAGVITTLIPDWARVSCRPQRNAVHRFTVDRHLVEAAANAAALTRRVARPDLLLVGALLHDIGKGWPGDHSTTGVTVVRDLAPRLGFAEPDVDVLALLVAHHLLLPDTATRRDLDDPRTLESVAAALGSVEVLDLMAALVEADALATGPAAWTPWRAELIATLVERTRAVLSGRPVPVSPGLTDAQRALARGVGAGGAVDVHLGGSAAAGSDEIVTVVSPNRVGLLGTVAGVFGVHRLVVRSAVTETIGTASVTVWRVHPEFGAPPDGAVLRGDLVRALDGSLDLTARLAKREAAQTLRPGIAVAPPAVAVVPDASASATVLEIRAHDRPGLLHRVGRALADAGVDICSAKVSTWGAEAVDVFYVVDPVTGGPLSDAAAAAVRKSLLAALD